MEFAWKIVGRTGEKTEGEDNFPKPELKETAATFELILPEKHRIQAPYGVDVFGDTIFIVVPDDSILVFKRRVRVTICGANEEREHTYIIAFEKIDRG
jgi:hypothetical protein